ncbi:MAG: hypothetical protein AB1728_07880 [Bacteroidota bacterium]
MKQLLGSGRLHLQSFPLTLESTAIDCIAELFERDSDGVFIELEHFFCVERDLTQLSDDDVAAYFRAIVFTKLHDGLFALYRENDPVLSKILRNVKAEIQKNSSFEIIQSLGISIIACRTLDERFHLQEVQLETVERHFGDTVRDSTSIGDYLRAFQQMMAREKDIRPSFPLIDFCVAIKRHMMHRKIPLTTVLSSDESTFHHDATILIDQAVAHMRKQLHERYVNKNKLSELHFNSYMEAISSLVYDTFILSDGSEKKYGEYLQQQLPTITYEEYRLYHRKQFEYMAKLVKKEVRERLRELL